MTFLEFIKARSLNKKPVDKLGPYRIFTVDASAIRDKSVADDEFNHFGTHLEFAFIPNNEVWISQDIDKHEQSFLINNGINQYEGKSKGVKDWYDYALRREKAEREKVDGVKMSKKIAPDKLYYKQYCTIRSDKIEVWLVDGELVRDLYKTDFIEGGSGICYPWIPINEIWIERNLIERGEINITILHEFVESSLMKINKMSYNKSHPIAAKVDWHHRRKFTKSDVESLTRSKALEMAKCYL
jgi:hypothetical protein